MAANPGAIQTGNEVVDNILTVLLSTSMFVAGVLGFTLDNTIPGTPEERGLVAWKKQHEAFQDDGSVSKIYDIPFITPYLERSVFNSLQICKKLGRNLHLYDISSNRTSWAKYIPSLPTYKGLKKDRVDSSGDKVAHV